MSILVFILLAVRFAIHAAEPLPPTAVSLAGYVIDNACVASHKDSLSTYVKKHTSSCPWIPGAKSGGFSLYTDEGVLTPFRKSSGSGIIQYLKRRGAVLKVYVMVEPVGDSLALISIRPRTSVR